MNMTLFEAIKVALRADTYEAFDDALYQLQSVLGQDDGMLAAMFFDGENDFDHYLQMNDKDRMALIHNYINSEILNQRETLI